MEMAPVTPYAQQENYETGRAIGRVDREWNSYSPPRNSDAALLAGYDAGWTEIDRLEESGVLNTPDTDEEAQFELDLEYLDLFG
jgi:hypothetical protein